MIEAIPEAPPLFQLVPAGLVCNRVPNYDEWAEIGRKLQGMLRYIHWWLGDWILLGERFFPDRYTQAVEDTGYSRQTIYNDRWVCSRIDPTNRRPNLDFSHHAVVAAFEPPDQARLLDRAEEHGYTVRSFGEVARQYRLELSRTALGAPEGSETTEAPSEAPGSVLARSEGFFDAVLLSGTLGDPDPDLVPGSVHLILVDLTCEDAFFYQWAQLARLADTMLARGGSLCAYAHQYAIDRVIADLKVYLNFHWLLTAVTPAAEWSKKGVQSCCRPIVWATKGFRSDDRPISDLLLRDPDQYLIESLTVECQTVFDPCCGAGERLKIAQGLKRRPLGMDRDPSSLEIAESNLRLR